MPWLFNRIPWSGSMVKCSRKHGVLHFLGFANVILGVMLGVYTGILLSALGARPLWSSALLGPLFLFSGLSTGAATLHILSHFTGDKSNRGGYRFSDAIGMAMVHWIRPKEADESKDLKLAQADNSFLTVELFILILFIIGMLSSTAVHQQAVGNDTDRTLCGIFLGVCCRYRHFDSPASSISSGNAADQTEHAASSLGAFWRTHSTVHFLFSPGRKALG